MSYLSGPSLSFILWQIRRHPRGAADICHTANQLPYHRITPRRLEPQLIPQVTEAVMVSATTGKQGFVEDVEIQGHIIDSLILPKVLDEILTHEGSYVIKDIRIGQRQTDPSYARIEVRANSAEKLRKILDTIHDHGAAPISVRDCQTVSADMDGAFPEGFYSTTSFRTQVRLGGEWIDVEDQEMDCGILVDPEEKAARCVPMAEVKKGDRIVVGRQ